MKIILILVFGLFLSICGSNAAIDNKTQKYGEKVSYADNKEIKFPDFSIKFTGKREVNYPNENSPRKMTFYDFEVAKGDAKQKISWSSGAGDIAPTFFEIDGANFVLELWQSDLLKSVGEGNLVIWTKVEYDESLKKYKK